MESENYFFIIILNEEKQYKNINCIGTFNKKYIIKQGANYIKEKIIDYEFYDYIQNIIIISILNNNKIDEIKKINNFNIDYTINYVENYNYTLSELSNLVNEYKPCGKGFFSKNNDLFSEYIYLYISKIIEDYDKELFEEYEFSYNYNYEDENGEQHTYITNQTFEFYGEDLTIEYILVNSIYDDGYDSQHVNNITSELKIVDTETDNQLDRTKLNKKLQDFIEFIETKLIYTIS